MGTSPVSLGNVLLFKSNFDLQVSFSLDNFWVYWTFFWAHRELCIANSDIELHREFVDSYIGTYAND
jgi:hypothetical protein